MAFTRQQVLEMQQKLASLGYKDTDFEILGTENIGGEEWVAVVDNGVNRRMLLADFEGYIIEKNIPDLDYLREAYHKPDGGIPRSDLSNDVQNALHRADLSVQPRDLQKALATKQNKLTFDEYPIAGSDNPVTSDGIAQAIGDIERVSNVSVNCVVLPKDANNKVDISVPDSLDDLADDAQHRLVTDAEKDRWNEKYDLPEGGIPASDLAPGIIPDLSAFITKWANDLVYYYKKSETYNKQEINNLIAGVEQYAPVVTDELPSPTEDTMYHLYLAPAEDPQVGNIYNEYITVDYGSEASPRYKWELVGSTAFDLSDYVTVQQLSDALSNYTTSTDLATLLAAKQDTLVSGDNIKTINGESILGSGDITAGDPYAVKYIEQTLTPEQQAQARENIDAARDFDVTTVQSVTLKTVNGESLVGVGDIPMPMASDDNPMMDGVAGAGVSDEYSRADHTHPSDTSKQNNLIVEVGGMERSNVSGTGSITITSTRGQFPCVTKAGTYTVITKMQSTTPSYGLAVTFGSNSYTLNTTNGVINDERKLTLAANAIWSGSVVGAVGANTYIYISVIGEGVVTTLANVAVTGSYNDLSNKVDENKFELKSNKASSIDTSTTKYPTNKAVSDALALKQEKIEIGTTAEWNSRIGYVPAAGEIVVYSDHASKEVDGQTVYIPGIKIGGGNGYVQDLAFVGDDIAAQLMAHINNNARHITGAERNFWNNKLNIDDEEEVVDEVLIFNRN